MEPAKHAKHTKEETLLRIARLTHWVNPAKVTTPSFRVLSRLSRAIHSSKVIAVQSCSNPDTLDSTVPDCEMVARLTFQTPMPLSKMIPLRISALAILLSLALPWPSRAADEAQPVLAWERTGPGGPWPRIEAADARLARLDGKQFGLRARLRLPADGAILTRQTPDRKSGWRLFVKDAALRFEAAFDWKNARNNRPLELSVPLAAIGAAPSHEVVVNFTGPVLELLVDGVLVDEEWPVGAIAQTGGEPLIAAGEVEKLALWNRALRPDEVRDSSGGAEAVARREREILGPERPVTQYWKPRGLNTGVGDCMPFFDAGRFHLFYLIDRHGHASKWGLGAHQWAHVSSADLVAWTHHPLAIAITDQDQGSICTGSAFAHEGAVHGFYAVRTIDGSPARLAEVRSADGVHFEKTAWAATLTTPYQGPPARDPVVFRDPATKLFHMLITTELLDSPVARRGGCLAQLVSPDLRAWEQREPALVPGFADQPECADWFEWKGWHYLVFSNNGVARYRMSRSPLGPWLAPKNEAFDGPQARVLKTAAFTGDRRLGAAFVTRAGSGYAGDLVMREIIQQPDGTLGTAFPAELRPAVGEKIALTFAPLTDGISGDAARVKIDAPAGLGIAAFDHLPADFRLKLRVHADPKTRAFGVCVRGSGRYEKGHELRLEPAREKVGWRPADAGTLDEHEASAIYAVEGLYHPIEVEVIVKGDLLDVCIDGRRTLIARAAPSFTGDRLFLFTQNGTATFENLEVQPLAPPAD